jgi:hypothetical protein
MFDFRSYLMLVLGLCIGVYVGFFIGTSTGLERGKDKQAAAQTTAILNKANSNAKHKQKVNALDNDKLKQSYCHWVYDASYDECIRTNIYVD